MVLRSLIQFCEAHPKLLVGGVLATFFAVVPAIFASAARMPLTEGDLYDMQETGDDEDAIIRAIQARGLAIDEMGCRRLLKSAVFENWPLFKQTVCDPTYRLSEQEYVNFMERIKLENEKPLTEVIPSNEHGAVAPFSNAPQVPWVGNVQTIEGVITLKRNELNAISKMTFSADSDQANAKIEKRRQRLTTEIHLYQAQIERIQQGRHESA